MPVGDMHPADMCPTKRKAIEEAEAASMFTALAAESPPDTSTPIFSPIADELSPLPMQSQEPAPTMNLWHDMLTTGNDITAQQAGMTIEQLLAATADYDNATGLAKSVDHWSDTALANMMVDDDLMSMWSAAPTFG